MPYKIFLSHIESDLQIAKAINLSLNNAFKGDIEICFVSEKIRVGDKWRNEIKSHLLNCDALITLVTPEAISKPWIYIEWSPFWLEGKKIYTLLSDDLKISELVQVFQDHQIMKNMMDTDEVKMFFEVLAEDSGHQKVPYESVQRFVDSVSLARKYQQKEKKDLSYGKFKENLDDLPRDDFMKRKIADYFYEEGNVLLHREIVNKIRDEGVVCDIALDRLENGDLKETLKVCEKLRGADKLSSIAIEMINKGYQDSKEIREILENIALINQAELRKVGKVILDLGQGESELFDYITLQLMSNNVEFHKLVIHLVNENKLQSHNFIELLEHFTNSTYLRKVLEIIIKSGYIRTPEFFHGFKILLSKSWTDVENIIPDINNSDAEYIEWIYAQKKISQNVYEKLKKSM